MHIRHRLLLSEAQTRILASTAKLTVAGLVPGLLQGFLVIESTISSSRNSVKCRRLDVTRMRFWVVAMAAICPSMKGVTLPAGSSLTRSLACHSAAEQVVREDGKTLLHDTLHVEIQNSSSSAIRQARYAVDQFVPDGRADGALPGTLIQPADQSSVGSCERRLRHDGSIAAGSAGSQADFSPRTRVTQCVEEIPVQAKVLDIKTLTKLRAGLANVDCRRFKSGVLGRRHDDGDGLSTSRDMNHSTRLHIVKYGRQVGPANLPSRSSSSAECT